MTTRDYYGVLGINNQDVFLSSDNAYKVARW